MIELKRPTTLDSPDFFTGSTALPYKFTCKSCSTSIVLDLEPQIKNSWVGRSEKLSDEELKELKIFYGIGLSGKSHDGGLPVFDKVSCKKCGAEYVIYCGVKETSNSDYAVTVNGIFQK